MHINKLFPRSNKQCFLNGVFQSGVFRWWAGSAWKKEGTKTLENTGVSRHLFVPLKRFASVASRGETTQKQRLEKTVWNSLVLTGLSRELGGGGFCLCLFSPPWGMTLRKKHINKILSSTQSRDNFANLFICLCVFPSLHL